jgi:hypothetical protein
MIRKEQLESRERCRLTFELPSDLDADAVHLLADFTDWQPVPFERLESGRWRLVQEVAPGRAYQFRYCAHYGELENYFNDSGADRTIPNEQGTMNALIRC